MHVVRYMTTLVMVRLTGMIVTGLAGVLMLAEIAPRLTSHDGYPQQCWGLFTTLFTPNMECELELRHL